MRIPRFLLVSMVLALLLAALPPRAMVARGPDPQSLLRVPCRDEAALGRILGTGMRVLLWQGGAAYGLAGAEAQAGLEALGLAPEIYRREAPGGDYYILWAGVGLAQALGERYGPPVSLGEGWYLLGLPPGAQLSGPAFARRLSTGVEAPRPPAPALLSPAAPGRPLAEVADQVSSERLTADVARLQGANARGSRYTMAPAVDGAVDYIAGQLAAAGLQVERSPFTATDHGHSAATRAASNVAGTLSGRRPLTDGFVVVCAHYDATASRDPAFGAGWSTLPAPGADDNASGVAAALEVARALAHYPLTYGVRFAFFGGEEQGLQGSEAYAEALHEEGANILGVIDLDMIAYDAGGSGLDLYANPSAASQALAAALVRNLQRYAPALRPTVRDDVNELSDQAPFRDRGYPAILVIEDWAHHSPQYHTAGDTLATLDLPFWTGVTRGAAATVAELAQPLGPDLSSSQALAAAAPGMLAPGVAYTVTVRNSGALTAAASLNATLDPELVPGGPIAASQGTAGWDASTHTLHWTGEVAPGAEVTITCRAWVVPHQPGERSVGLAAVLDDGAGHSYNLQAGVRGSWQLTLPLFWRQP